MPLDPQIASLLEFISATPPMSSQTAEVARAGFRALTVDLRRPETVVPVGSVEDIKVPGADGELAARVYRPLGGAEATIALFHGGGFVIGDLDTHDNLARALCRGTQSAVVSVDYRLAPEAPFPAGVHDAIAVTGWLLEHIADFGGGRLAVAGDSAGGNLSAVVAQAVPGLVGQFLIYPTTDMAGDYPSRTENAEGYFLDMATMEWFLQQYLTETVDLTDPELSPLHGSLAGLPPAVVVTAEFDPLRDEGIAYADALAAAGVPVVQKTYPGMIHGFMDMGGWSPAAQDALDESIAMFAELLAGAGKFTTSVVKLPWTD